MGFPVYLPEEIKRIEHSAFYPPVKLGLMSWCFFENKCPQLSSQHSPAEGSPHGQSIRSGIEFY